MMHLLHQHAVLRERGLKCALSLTRVLGHRVDRLCDASQLRWHSRIDRSGRTAVRVAASLARCGFNPPDPPHDVTLDGTGVGQAEEDEQCEGRETERNEAPPRIDEPLLVEPHQDGKVRRDNRRHDKGGQAAAPVAPNPNLVAFCRFKGFRQPTRWILGFRLRKRRRSPGDQRNVRFSDREKRRQTRPDGLALEDDDAVGLGRGRVSRARGCDPKPVPDDRHPKSGAGNRRRRRLRKLGKIDGFAGRAGLAVGVDEVDRGVIRVQADKRSGELGASIGVQEGGLDRLIDERAADRSEP